MLLTLIAEERPVESKTIPFNKDGLANVLSFGGQRCRPWQYA